MSKELDKKRLLAILEKKVNKISDKSKSHLVNFFPKEDLNERVIIDDSFQGKQVEYIELIPHASTTYIGELLTEIEFETHRRFELKNPFTIGALPDEPDFFKDKPQNSTAYEVTFNPWIKQKTTEDLVNEMHFELENNKLRLIGFPFKPITFKSDIKLSIIKQLAEAKATGPIGTAELTNGTDTKSEKTVSNYIKEINDKVCETFKLQPDEFIPKSTPGAGYRLGDRIFIRIKD